MELADKKCSDGVSVPALKVLRARELLKELGQGWTLNGRGHLMRLYTQKVLFWTCSRISQIPSEIDQPSLAF